MDSIPSSFKPLVQRLQETCPDLSRQDLLSIVLVIRIADILHQSFYASFQTLSLTSKLCNHLKIPELFLELDVFTLHWSFRQGTVAVSHRITFDYDMHACYTMTTIARSILGDKISVKEALQQVQAHSSKQGYTRMERCYESFPTRSLIIPLMAATCATVFFHGTWYDFGVATLCGLVAGIVAAICTRFSQQLMGVLDYLVAISTAMISVASVQLFPNHCCFSAQVSGTLYWFFYGTAFVLSLYEITNNQLMVGISRFTQATLKSYGLAFGAIIGVWLAWYGPQDRYSIIDEQCQGKLSQISDYWFILLFPLAGIACLMQFRVSLCHFPLCLTVQCISYGSQYVIGTIWKQPDFISNMIPAYLATLSSSIVINMIGGCGREARESSKSDEERTTIDAIGVIECKDSMAETEPCSPQFSESCVEEVIKQDCTDDGSVKDTPIARTPTPSIRDEHGKLPEMSLVDGTPTARRRPHRSTSNANPQPRQQDSNREYNSDTFGFVDADSNSNNVNDLAFTARNDIWFCLLPALYLLVPGAKIFKTAFFGVVESVLEQNNHDLEEIGSLGFSLLGIGLAQAIGLRLGFVTLWLVNVVCNNKWIKGCHGWRR